MESFTLEERKAAEEKAVAAFNDPNDPLGGLEPPAFTLASKTRPDLTQLIQKVMSGQIPRSRELKSWEPDYLDERHIQAVMMRSAGLPQGEIARLMGWTESWVSIVLNHPDASMLLAKMVSYAADNVLDVKAKIAAVSGEMLQRVIDITRSTADEKLASKNAFDLLALAGYTPVQKIEAKTQTIHASHEQIDDLTAAIRESSRIRDLEVIETSVAGTSVDPGNAPPSGTALGSVLPTSQPQSRVA